MARAAANRAYDDLHEARPWHDGTFKVWTSERTAGTPFQYREGVGIWVSRFDLTPDDDFLSPPEVPSGD